MPRVATKLSPLKSGGWTARKRIPADAQEAYAELYGVRWEARLTLEAMPVDRARLKQREWENEVDARIINIRAQRKGDGQTLTPKQARALSGEWYRWFTERHLKRALAAAHWEDFRERINDTLRDEVLPYADARYETNEIDDILERSEPARADIRPIFADLGETAQFLAHRRMVLDAPSRDLFLDSLYHDMGEALRLLIKRARRDWTPDTYPLQFPKFDEGRDTGQGPWKLFELWVEAAKPAASTVDRWRGVFLQLDADFKGRSAGSITADDAQEWADKLITPERTAATVSDVWVVAARTVWGWALTRKHVAQNPFKTVRITVRRLQRTRGKTFTPKEVKIILSAALAITDTKSASAAARRWVPWLCAYTGARVGEITQLRKEDVREEEGVWVIHITPAAGTVKTREGRVVPIHEHLIAQGFLTFVKSHAKGPLFYNEAKEKPQSSVATNPKKARYVKAREHLADWVRRDLKVTDREIRPNHAWRHTFQNIADRVRIPEKMSDYITGHAPANVGRGYGAPSVADMAEALKSYPRYEVINTEDATT